MSFFASRSAAQSSSRPNPVPSSPPTQVSRRTALTACVSAIGITALLSSCGTGQGGSGSASTPSAPQLSDWSAKPSGPIDSFSWVVSGEPTSFDSTRDNSTHLARVLPNVVERLLWRQPDGKLVPGLAESWQQLTPTRYSFALRSGVTFHNGDHLGPQDVIDSLNRSRADDSVWAHGLASIESIEADGDAGVVITLGRPDALLLAYLSTAAGSIESRKTLRDAGDKYGSSPEFINGTGPFALTSWQRGSTIELAKHDDYWGTAALAGAVTVKILEDSVSRNQALSAGEIDGSSAISAGSESSITTVGAGKKGSMYFGAGSSTWAVAFFNSDGILADPKVRRALSMAIDREGLVIAASGGNAEPAGDFAAPALWAGDKQRAQPLGQDIDSAKKLIASARVSGSELVLSYSAQSSTVTPMATAVQAAGEAIGLKIKLREVSVEVTNAFQADPESRKGTDMSLAQISTQAYDPLDVYERFTSGSPRSYSGYGNPKVDSLLARARNESDQASRETILAQTRSLLLGDMPWIPLISAPVAVFFGETITGGPTSAAGTQNFPWAAYVGSR
ncbi:ABC transporter substrate-binding protein [Saxibacter everestensis]|uniref:ABC transporter substrate-binding protein n=1 Tax=Saxibacter everestensis TaxID=2909229 RepID=A0ABY8QQK3_9MICO|nr:ABC transporter substrate-binding protein [Brevibacteriaceae bacterium ZFBP1038]